MCLGLFFSLFPLYAQVEECGTKFNPKDIIHLPHFGQNEVLDEILKITMGKGFVQNRNNSSYRTTNVPYNIPVKIWVYRNDDGSNSALSLPITNAERIFDDVNQHFSNNNTGIQFYLNCVEVVNSTQFNFVEKSEEKNIVTQHYKGKMMNWHFVHTINYAGGYAYLPWTDRAFQLVVEFKGNYNNTAGNDETVAHEIGHSLGLQHTHDNARGKGDYNGDAEDCYQEAVSRSKKQAINCSGTYKKQKCSINGDALCDTDAAPNTKLNNSIILNSSNCNYAGGGSDNWGIAWTPPTTNYMSYLERKSCRSNFTANQIGVMHGNIVKYMKQDGKNWYNLNTLGLSGTVNSGENKNYVLPTAITVASGNETYTVKTGATVNLHAGEKIVLDKGFKTENNAIFKAKVAPINNCDIVYNGFGRYTSPKTYKEELTRTITNNKEKQLNKIIDDALDRVKTFVSENNVLGTDELLNKHKVYPNPFNNTVTFSFYVAQPTNATISIYSVLGNTAFKTTKTVLKTGYYTTAENLSYLPKGVYTYKISTNTNDYIGKLVK